jgi:hypothetical protein
MSGENSYFSRFFVKFIEVGAAGVRRNFGPLRRRAAPTPLGGRRLVTAEACNVPINCPIKLRFRCAARASRSNGAALA